MDPASFVNIFLPRGLLRHLCRSSFDRLCVMFLKYCVLLVCVSVLTPKPHLLTVAEKQVVSNFILHFQGYFDYSWLLYDM
jgi:hypothetical protein